MRTVTDCHQCYNLWQGFFNAKTAAGRYYSSMLACSVFLIVSLYTGSFAAMLSTTPQPVQAITSIMSFFQVCVQLFSFGFSLRPRQLCA